MVRPENTNISTLSGSPNQSGSQPSSGVRTVGRKFHFGSHTVLRCAILHAARRRSPNPAFQNGNYKTNTCAPVPFSPVVSLLQTSCQVSSCPSSSLSLCLLTTYRDVGFTNPNRTSARSRLRASQLGCAGL